MLGRWMINLRVFFFILVDDEIVKRGDKRMLMLFLLLRCKSNSVDVFFSFRLQSNLAENSPLTQKKKVKNCLYRWKVPLDFKIGLWTWREASGGKATDFNWSLFISRGDLINEKTALVESILRHQRKLRFYEGKTALIKLILRYQWKLRFYIGKTAFMELILRNARKLRFYEEKTALIKLTLRYQWKLRFHEGKTALMESVLRKFLQLKWKFKMFLSKLSSLFFNCPARFLSIQETKLTRPLSFQVSRLNYLLKSFLDKFHQLFIFNRLSCFTIYANSICFYFSSAPGENIQGNKVKISVFMFCVSSFRRDQGWRLLKDLKRFAKFILHPEIPRKVSENSSKNPGKFLETCFQVVFFRFSDRLQFQLQFILTKSFLDFLLIFTAEIVFACFPLKYRFTSDEDFSRHEKRRKIVRSFKWENFVRKTTFQWKWDWGEISERFPGKCSRMGKILREIS